MSSFQEHNPEVLGKKLKENQKELEKATATLQQKDSEMNLMKDKLVNLLWCWHDKHFPNRI